MTIYTCESRFRRILYGVYDAWSDSASHENVRLAVKGEYGELELFAEYRGVQIYPEKAEKVIRPVRIKLSRKIYGKVYIASLSRDRERADKIYRSLIQAFRHDPSVLDILQLPACYDVFDLCRNVYNKNHLLAESLQFLETPEGILVSCIGPENDIMTPLAPHFADQLPEENWVAYDESHKKAAVHPAGCSWFLVNQPPGLERENSDRGWSCWPKERTDEETYEGI